LQQSTSYRLHLAEDVLNGHPGAFLATFGFITRIICGEKYKL
jgi:hypothetical protein